MVARRRLAPQSTHFDSVSDPYDVDVRTDFDIPFWLVETRSVRGKVLELACGTGRVSIPLLAAGVDLTCVDYAPRVLEILERKLKRVAIQSGSPRGSLPMADRAALHVTDP